MVTDKGGRCTPSVQGVGPPRILNNHCSPYFESEILEHFPCKIIKIIVCFKYIAV